MSIPDIQEATDLIDGGTPEEAIPALEEWTRRIPRYVALHVLLARAYEADGQRAAAEAAWQRASMLMPNSPAIREALERMRAAPTPTGEPTTLDTVPVLQVRPADLEEALAGEEPMSVAEASLALVEAALAAAEAEAGEEAAPPDIAPAPPPVETAVPSPEALPDASDAKSIYEEIERMIEARSRQKEAPDAVDEPPPTQEAAPPEALADDIEDLDRLIGELESARIDPAMDLDDVPPPDLDDEIDDVVSETLARIYASQAQYEEAARVYEQLAGQQPDQSIKFLEEAARMRALATGAEGPPDEE